MTRRPFHVLGSGHTVVRRGGRLVALQEGVARVSAPLAMISDVLVSGRVTVTTPALHSLLANDIPLVLLTEDGRALGRLEPPGARAVEIRLRQLDAHRDPALRLGVGRRIVAGKIHNQAVLLRRRARRSTDPDAVWATVARLAVLEDRVAGARSEASLLGVEGAAAGLYFRAAREVIAPEFGFGARDRAARDVVNMLLNYCSALLRETVFAAVVAAGLDPALSFLHTPVSGRPTLVFDLMDEWRPILLEITVLALLGLGLGRVDTDRLADSTRAAAVRRFHARLAAPARSWPAAAPGSSYADVVRRQSLRLRDELRGGALYEPVRWR